MAQITWSVPLPFINFWVLNYLKPYRSKVGLMINFGSKLEQVTPTAIDNTFEKDEMMNVNLPAGPGYSAVAGSIIVETFVIVLAGKPAISACFLIRSSLGAI